MDVSYQTREKTFIIISNNEKRVPGNLNKHCLSVFYMPSIDTKTTEKQGNIIITIYGNYEHISQHCDDYDYFCVNTLNYQ